MPKPDYIELGGGRAKWRLPILFEDRAVLAIDKPAGWLLAPVAWQRTGRNLTAAIISSIHAGDFWARSRNLKYLRFMHRLDAETTGIVLWAKSPGALNVYTKLFERRMARKTYLAVVQGIPEQQQWICRQKIAPDPRRTGQMIIEPRQGKMAETHFRLLAARNGVALIEAQPVTGRTHQIRLHLAASGCPVLGDALYGAAAEKPPPRNYPLALRAVQLAYVNPFTKHPVTIVAPHADFTRTFGFAISGPF
jgi:RluA family pseudouridine synthase